VQESWVIYGNPGTITTRVALEMAAAKAMLDEVHDSLPQPKTDHNVYILDAISNHNVVMVCLLSDVYGMISTSAVVSHIRNHADIKSDVKAYNFLQK